MLVGERVGGHREVLDEPAQVALADGDIGHQVARLDDEVRELVRVPVELTEQHAARGDRRVQVRAGALRSRALVWGRVGGRGALDYVLDRLAGRRIKRVEQLVEVDRAGRVL